MKTLVKLRTFKLTRNVDLGHKLRLLPFILAVLQLLTWRHQQKVTLKGWCDRVFVPGVLPKFAPLTLKATFS